MRMWKGMSSGQKKISSYFTSKPIATKREVLAPLENDEPSKKLLKTATNSKKDIGRFGQTTLTAGRLSQSNKKTMGPSWSNALNPELTKPYYKQLMAFLNMERNKYTIYPPPEQVFSWTHHCDIKDVKVVILGQDPYHGPGQAHGLCFSVQKGIPPPPSLQNIYKELKDDLGTFERPGHGDLTGWTEQGVLLLNAVLTVRSGEANSHRDKGWETFTDAVIWWLNTNLSGVVFMLWGAYAQKKGSRINLKKHKVLSSSHPSPLSAYRGFFGCKHFSRANAYLDANGKTPINWNLSSTN